MLIFLGREGVILTKTARPSILYLYKSVVWMIMKRRNGPKSAKISRFFVDFGIFVLLIFRRLDLRPNASQIHTGKDITNSSVVVQLAK